MKVVTVAQTHHSSYHEKTGSREHLFSEAVTQPAMLLVGPTENQGNVCCDRRYSGDKRTKRDSAETT
jgi:hypothetical protein